MTLQHEAAHMAFDDEAHNLARQLLERCEGFGVSLACAESLTGGMLASTLVDIPGASRSFFGGVVSYTNDVKARVLAVSETALAITGPVDEEVAREMAKGVREVIGTDIGISTTGVAGPGSADGHEAGTVWIGVAGEQWSVAQCFHFTGDRDDVRRQSVKEALGLALRSLRKLSDS